MAGLILISMGLVLVYVIFSWYKKRFISEHIDAMSIVLAKKILEKYKPDSYLNLKEIQHLKDAVQSASNIFGHNERLVELIAALETNKSFNEDQVLCFLSYISVDNLQRDN
ncbi:hypothetical protein [Paenibacillus agilis]|uniref:Uncharacterized protein n=1 Tax=Paenibacillus agilis TaxID=3020863 RepID=A0A559ID98_9BACL|nr:hypothetical protein [Paenibacillus agilis]TVX85596.1 hypothetical protein FPZ44_24895 [Paenibacillus agilis]